MPPTPARAGRTARRRVPAPGAGRTRPRTGAARRSRRPRTRPRLQAARRGGVRSSLNDVCRTCSPRVRRQRAAPRRRCPAELREPSARSHTARSEPGGRSASSTVASGWLAETIWSRAAPAASAASGTSHVSPRPSRFGLTALTPGQAMPARTTATGPSALRDAPAASVDAQTHVVGAVGDGSPGIGPSPPQLGALAPAGSWRRTAAASDDRAVRRARRRVTVDGAAERVADRDAASSTCPSPSGEMTPRESASGGASRLTGGRGPERRRAAAAPGRRPRRAPSMRYASSPRAGRDGRAGARAPVPAPRDARAAAALARDGRAVRVEHRHRPGERRRARAPGTRSTRAPLASAPSPPAWRRVDDLGRARSPARPRRCPSSSG